MFHGAGVIGPRDRLQRGRTRGTACDPYAISLLPHNGPTLQGKFTVTRAALPVGAEIPSSDPSDPGYVPPPREYQVHYVLWRDNIEHQFMFSWDASSNPVLCAYSDEDLLETMFAIPCYQSVGEPFGFPLAIPFVEKLTVNSRDRCENGWTERISGDLVVRLYNKVK